MKDLIDLNIIEFISKYDYQLKITKVELAYNDIKLNKVSILEINYKVFDKKHRIYTGKTNGLMGRPRFEMMKNIIEKDNVCLCLLRSLVNTSTFSSIFISKSLVDKNLYGFQTSLFPLYLYSQTNGQNDLYDQDLRIPNLNPEILNQIAKGLGLTFTPEKETEGEVCFAKSQEVRPEFKQTFAPIDLLDYIYAVLHSPSYREKYKEFLKIDFPRVPYPTDVEFFWKLVALGGELRQLHLLESKTVENYITQYPIDGNNVVDKPTFVISEEQRVMNFTF